jgi:hypothetical protein
MLYVVKENEDQVDVLNLTLRCRECGNTWRVELGRNLTAPENILSCYRCLARKAGGFARQGVNDER